MHMSCERNTEAVFSVVFWVDCFNFQATAEANNLAAVSTARNQYIKDMEEVIFPISCLLIFTLFLYLTDNSLLDNGYLQISLCGLLLKFLMCSEQYQNKQ